MTQKELLYLEDAAMHEENIVCIFSELIKNMQDEDLITFLKKELKKHNAMANTIIKCLKEKSNDR